jgi:hypothetical protein
MPGVSAAGREIVREIFTQGSVRGVGREIDAYSANLWQRLAIQL